MHECIEHYEVITRFVVMAGSQINKKNCRALLDNVRYKWEKNEGKVVIPDASICCDTSNRTAEYLLEIPRFVMEVVSESTEKYDRGEKMDIYRKMEIDEYWIVDWRKRKVEIYSLDYDESENPVYVLCKEVTRENKADLEILHFPNIKIDFDELFDI